MADIVAFLRERLAERAAWVATPGEGLEVAAIRSVIDSAAQWHETFLASGGGYARGMVDGLEMAVSILGQVYAGHPDFDDAWRL